MTPRVSAKGISNKYVHPEETPRTWIYKVFTHLESLRIDVFLPNLGSGKRLVNEPQLVLLYTAYVLKAPVNSVPAY